MHMLHCKPLDIVTFIHFGCPTYYGRGNLKLKKCFETTVDKNLKAFPPIQLVHQQVPKKKPKNEMLSTQYGLQKNWPISVYLKVHKQYINIHNELKKCTMDLTVQCITYKVTHTRMNFFLYAKHLNPKRKHACDNPYYNFKTP